MNIIAALETETAAAKVLRLTEIRGLY